MFKCRISISIFTVLCNNISLLTLSFIYFELIFYIMQMLGLYASTTVVHLISNDSACNIALILYFERVVCPMTATKQHSIVPEHSSGIPTYSRLFKFQMLGLVCLISHIAVRENLIFCIFALPYSIVPLAWLELHCDRIITAHQ